MSEVKKNTFRKHERLCSQKIINALFQGGKGLYYFPFRIVYSVNVESSAGRHVQVAITVPKKLFKRAVKRNLLKRRIREAYRINKTDFYAKLPPDCTINIMLIYVSPTIIAYNEIEFKLKSALHVLAKHLEKSIDIPADSVD